MTLIVGVHCSNGIVIGSDGAATFGALGQPTARQPTPKLSIINPSTIVGVSGSVGLKQRFEGEIETLIERNSLKKKKLHDAGVTISDVLREHQLKEMKAAKESIPIVGMQAAQSSAIAMCLVATVVGDKPVCYQFDHQGAPERLTKHLPFVALGSGQAIADPFLALLRRVFWKDTLPTTADALFATCWCVDHAIKTNVGGVAEPIQMTILESRNGQWVARELADEECQEHMQAASDAESALVNWRDELGKEVTDEEQMPSPED